MTLEEFVFGAQWVFLAYFVGINFGYLAQNVIATYGIRRAALSLQLTDPRGNRHAAQEKSTHLDHHLVLGIYITS